MPETLIKLAALFSGVIPRDIPAIRHFSLVPEVSRHPRSSTEGESDLGTFVVLTSEGNSEARHGEAILIN